MVGSDALMTFRGKRLRSGRWWFPGPTNDPEELSWQEAAGKLFL